MCPRQRVFKQIDPIPPSPTDPRLNSTKLTWINLQETKKGMLQCYQVTVSRVLSRITPTELESLRHILVFDYYFFVFCS
jgi:hypothetical protein